MERNPFASPRGGKPRSVEPEVIIRRGVKSQAKASAAATENRPVKTGREVRYAGTSEIESRKPLSREVVQLPIEEEYRNSPEDADSMLKNRFDELKKSFFAYHALFKEYIDRHHENRSLDYVLRLENFESVPVDVKKRLDQAEQTGSKLKTDTMPLWPCLQAFNHLYPKVMEHYRYRGSSRSKTVAFSGGYPRSDALPTEKENEDTEVKKATLREIEDVWQTLPALRVELEAALQEENELKAILSSLAEEAKSKTAIREKRKKAELAEWLANKNEVEKARVIERQIEDASSMIRFSHEDFKGRWAWLRNKAGYFYSIRTKLHAIFPHLPMTSPVEDRMTALSTEWAANQERVHEFATREMLRSASPQSSPEKTQALRDRLEQVQHMKTWLETMLVRLTELESELSPAIPALNRPEQKNTKKSRDLRAQKHGVGTGAEPSGRKRGLSKLQTLQEGRSDYEQGKVDDEEEWRKEEDERRHERREKEWEKKMKKKGFL